jgi:hypothetical protein
MASTINPLLKQVLFKPSTMEPFKILAFYVEGVCHLIKVVFVRLDALLERYSSSSKDSISD